MRLSDIRPHLDAQTLAARFVPPARFDDARFATYRPDPDFPSQAETRSELEDFAAQMARADQPKRWWKRKSPPDGSFGRYLDGGFGIGKTHLLASLWHACEGNKAYLSFGELTAYIGFAGMENATQAFTDKRLVCIDEFELDDVANTLMVVTFFRHLLANGTTYLAVTSNTLPGKLGEQRFSASEFKREIAAISSHFDEMKIDGQDYRTSHTSPQLVDRADGGHSTVDDFDDLLAHLQTVHPVHYGAMLDGIESVEINGAHVVEAQDDALLVVQMIDKLYDAKIPVRISGCAPEEMWAPRYRNGGYRKKYGRAESRITAMTAESAGSSSS